MKAHSSQRRPTQAYEDEKGPKRRGIYFFKCTIYFLPTTPIVGPDNTHTSPRRPTAANDGQCRPTKTKKGPNDARCLVWAIGTFFFKCTIYFLHPPHP